jgi:hypothetical protein
MASDYPSKFIILGYFIDNQDAGTGEERATWANDLFDRFDKHIVEACKGTPVEDPSDEARAIMAIMALNAPGSQAPKKAKNAVAAYVAYRT